MNTVPIMFWCVTLIIKLLLYIGNTFSQKFLFSVFLDMSKTWNFLMMYVKCCCCCGCFCCCCCGGVVVVVADAVVVVAVVVTIIAYVVVTCCCYICCHYFNPANTLFLSTNRCSSSDLITNAEQRVLYPKKLCWKYSRTSKLSTSSTGTFSCQTWRNEWRTGKLAFRKVGGYNKEAIIFMKTKIHWQEPGNCLEKLLCCTYSMCIHGLIASDAQPSFLITWSFDGKW